MTDQISAIFSSSAEIFCKILLLFESQKWNIYRVYQKLVGLEQNSQRFIIY